MRFQRLAPTTIYCEKAGSYFHHLRMTLESSGTAAIYP